MAYRPRTLRTMSPTASKLARLAGELDSVAKRLKHLVPEIQRIDLDSKALEFPKGHPDHRVDLSKHPAEPLFPQELDRKLTEL